MSGLLTVEDLLEGLTPEERRKMTPASRKLLEKLSTQPAAAAAVAASGKKKGKQQGKAEATLAPVAAPLPRAIKERQERKAGYIETKEDVSKWMPIIKVRFLRAVLRMQGASLGSSRDLQVRRLPVHYCFSPHPQHTKGCPSSMEAFFKCAAPFMCAIS